MKNNLPALRKESGITQKAIANKLNITYQSYYNKEIGRSEFTISEAFKLSVILHKNINDIFFIDNNPKWSKSGTKNR